MHGLCGSISTQYAVSPYRCVGSAAKFAAGVHPKQTSSGTFLARN
jgi:hypothetical protein